MTTLTIDLDDTDYATLEASATRAGLSVATFLKRLICGRGREDTSDRRPETVAEPSRWARISERIRQDAPLRGASHVVREHSLALREDFALTPDDVEDP